MSYAIIRNEKLTRAQAMGAYKHNERKTKDTLFGLEKIC